MSKITCTLECGHEIAWHDEPHHPGADLPFVGRVVWCPECESDQEVVELDGFAKAFISALDIDDLPEVSKDEFIVVFDLEHEGFGVFETAQEALAAVKNSNPDWWANRPYFTTLRREGCRIGTAVVGNNEYLTLFRKDGSERNPYDEAL